jgi:hypothetical protein
MLWLIIKIGEVPIPGGDDFRISLAAASKDGQAQRRLSLSRANWWTALRLPIRPRMGMPVKKCSSIPDVSALT